jgi:hypothetical protein
VGLGLSVTRSIILEHDGEIILAAGKRGGLSVPLKLPISLGADLQMCKSTKEYSLIYRGDYIGFRSANVFCLPSRDRFAAELYRRA